MAGRKEYEFAFMLSAKANSSYSRTFKNAQSTLTALQKDIGQLNRAQSDISAYQKQQSAVDATGRRLEVLKQQYDNIQKEIAETEGFSSSLENKLLSKQQQIDRTSQSLGQQTDKLGQMGLALHQAGVDTSDLTNESKRLDAEISNLKKEQEEAAVSVKSFGEQGAEAFDAIATAVTAAGISTALKEIAEGYMECIQAAGDFEETMSTVEALSQANQNEMAALSEEAKRLGAATQFTAQESAEAMTYMGMAGWKSGEMLSGMDGVIQLAAASGEDLAQVSDIVTDNLTAFGMTAADTARFSDVLAAAATNSNTSVSVMGETFKQSASIAGALGYSIEDVAVGIGLMANSGVKGSIAGTALKNTFNGLLEGATLTGNALGEYEFTAIKADGTMKSFSETIDELRACFAGMTEAEKVSNAMTVAGQRGYNGLLAILNSTEKDYNSLTQSIQNCTGAASKMASIKLNNMNGQLKLAKSAWEGVTIAVGEQFTPEMTKLYQIAADVFSEFKEFIEEHPALIKAATAFTAVVGTATAGMTAYAAVVKVVKLLDVATLFSGPVGIIIGAVGAVAALTAGVVAFVSSVNEGVPSVKELTEAARNMDEAMIEASDNYNATSTEMAATASVAETYIGKLERIERETRGNVEGNQEYHNILELLTRTIPELSEYIDLETNSIEGGTQALREHTEAWKQDAQAKAEQEYLNSLMDGYNEVAKEQAENSIKLTQAQMREQEAQENKAAAMERMEEIYKEIEDAEEKYGFNSKEEIEISEKLGEEYRELESSLQGYDKEIKQSQKEQANLERAVAEGKEAMAEHEKDVEDARAAIEKKTEAEREAAGQSQALTEQESAIAQAAGETKQQIEELEEAYEEQYRVAHESVAGQYALWDEAAKVTAKSVSDINSNMQSQAEYWKSYNDNMQSLSGRTGEIEGLRDVIASFADGSQESVNAIAGMSAASDEDLRAMVTNWQALQQEQEAASGSIADLKTNFTAEMDALGQELAADIQAMDLGPEAAVAAKATIQEYINGANSMIGQVQAAYAGIAAAAQAALGSVRPGAGSGVAGTGGGVGGSGPGISGNAYASGTDSAQPGFALVGENGPEIMFMNGGEKILNAAETARARQELSSANAALQAEAGTGVQAVEAIETKGAVNIVLQVENSPIIHAQGGNAESIAEQLKQHDANLLEQIRVLVETAIKEQREQEERVAYA